MYLPIEKALLKCVMFILNFRFGAVTGVAGLKQTIEKNT